jgi:4-hydroxy-tetrahydrodipicolinate synthase
MLAVGAEGVVSVAANLVPREVIALVEAFERGDLAEARRIHHRLFPLCRDLLSVAVNPIPVKTALGLLGRVSDEMRLPLSPLDDAGRAAVRASLARSGLIAPDA